jgi:hypothetical protein
MAFRTRLQRLLRNAPDGRWCRCRIEQVVVRYAGEPGPAEAEARDADGRPVCGTCGLPRPPGPLPHIVIIMPGPEDEAVAP